MSRVTNAQPPVTRAMVFICEKCGRRAESDGKNPSHRLASKLKRATKRRFERGEIRIALTTCLDLCPDDRIAVMIQPVPRPEPARFLSADFDDVEACAERLVKLIAGEDTPR